MIRSRNENDELPHESSGSAVPAVRVDQLSKRFSIKRRDIEALSNINFEIPAGRIVGLVGPDGAGKTTLMRLIAGLMKPTSGRIEVVGHDVGQETLAVQAVLGYMPQRFGLYEDLTVQENLDLYADLQGTPHAQRAERYEELLHMTGLGPFVGRLAGKLSGGMKQKLGLACVLVRSPRLLLLDEPTTGVDPLSRRELWQIVRRLVEREGTTVLVSTGYLDEVSFCQDVLMLDEGCLLGFDVPASFTQRVEGCTFAVSSSRQKARDLQATLSRKAAVLDAAIEAGRVRFVIDRDAASGAADVLAGMPDLEWEEVKPRFEDSFVATLRLRRGRESDEPPAVKHAGQNPAAAEVGDVAVIKVDSLQRRFGDFYAVKGVSFAVQRGEVLGLLGANGAGKTTTFRMLCGLLPPTHGTLEVAGVDMRRAAAEARAKIGYMSQKFSLYRDLSVVENLRFFGSAYGLSRRHRRGRVGWALDQFQLESWKDKSSGALPLGYQQRLALACALLHEPQILFLDEPTSGVDPLARREFWRRISELSSSHVTVLVTTHFMEEAEHCDRLAIMMAGEILSLGTPREIREEARSPEHPRPTIEDAFVQLIQQREEPSAS